MRAPRSIVVIVATVAALAVAIGALGPAVGSAAAPGLSADPRSVDLGSVPVGQMTYAGFRITNNTGENIYNFSFVFSDGRKGVGTQEAFLADSSTCQLYFFAIPLLPGGECDYVFAITPTAVGRWEDRVTVFGGGADVTIRLIIRGV